MRKGIFWKFSCILQFLVKGRDDIRTEHVHMCIRLCKSCQALPYVIFIIDHNQIVLQTTIYFYVTLGSKSAHMWYLEEEICACSYHDMCFLQHLA
jgi:heptaprenylglyceryl phosphate synthase